jgi:hypothetical protein
MFPHPPVEDLESGSGLAGGAGVANNLVFDKSDLPTGFPRVIPAGAEAALNSFCTVSTAPTVTATDSVPSISSEIVGIRSQL